MNTGTVELDLPHNSFRKDDPIIQIVSSRILRGCNIHHSATVIRLVLDIAVDQSATSADLGPAFRERFIERFLAQPLLLPKLGLAEALAGRLRAGEPVAIANLLIEAILAMEAAMASEARVMEVVDFAELGPGDAQNRLVFIWSTKAPRFSRDLAEVALLGMSELLGGAMRNAKGQPLPSFEKALGALRERARRRRLAASNTVLIQAARERGIPAARTGTSHVRLGEGRHQTVFRSATTTTTSYAATRLSINKRLTNRRLLELRLPVPRQVRATTPAAAVAAAEEIGYPVVVKPVKGSRGAGITVGAGTADEVRDAFGKASGKKADVVVEALLAGDDHRLLVVGDRCIAGVKRIPPSVTGDGHQTIAALIDRLNQDPFRDNFRMFQVAIDDELIAHLSGRGLKPDDVLDAGVEVPLRSVSNVSKGGTPIDITDEIHPLNREAAVRAAQGIGLDIAGVDMITTDISKPYTETGGAINEVNARPGLDLHRFPRHGAPRDVAGAILDLVYPEGAPSRIVKAVVIGDQRTSAVARDVDAFVRGAGRTAGLTLRQAAFVNGARQRLTKRQHRRAARLLLRDPEIEFLIATAAPRDIVAHGLQFQETGAIALMPPSATTDRDDYRSAISVALASAPGLVVVDDDNSVALAELSEVPSERIALVSRRGETPRIKEHLAAGGRAAFIEVLDEQRTIVLKQGDGVLARMPITALRLDAVDRGPEAEQLVEVTGRRSRRISTRLYAAVLAHALGLAPEEIAHEIAASPAVVK